MYCRQLIRKLKQSLKTGVPLEPVIDDDTEYLFRYSGLDHWNVVEINPVRKGNETIKLFLQRTDQGVYYYSVLVNNAQMVLTEEQFDLLLFCP